MTGPRERRKPSRPKVGAEEIDYKNLQLLRKFITENGKIVPRKASRVTARQQRQLARAIKRARYLALLPFCAHHR